MARQRAALTRVVTVAEQHGRRFRNKYMLDGKSVSDSFATEAEAREAAARFRREHAQEAGPTVKGLFDMWIAARKSEGKQEAACITLGIETMLGEYLDAPAASVTAKQMADAYDRARVRVSKYGRPVSVATHQEALKWTRAFWRWAVERGYVRRNPCETIRPLGKRNRRKPQIETLTELHRFKERAFARAYAGDRAALGILVSLYLGPRSGEVRGILARHVDRAVVPRLVVAGTKTENAYRAIRVQAPEVWELLCRAADEAKSPTERLIPHHQQTLLARVKEIGREIGLPEEVADKLTFQSLRGMAASLATQGDAAGAAIASLLGHSSFKITKAHYSTIESQTQAQQRANVAVLDGGTAGDEMSPNRSQPSASAVTAQDHTQDGPG